MYRFHATVYAISRGGAVISAAAMVFMVLTIGLEVFLRSVMSTSTYVMDELVGYAMAICTIWSLGYVLESNNLIRVNLLLPHLPKMWADIMTAMAAFISCAAVISLAYFFLTRALRSLSRGTVSPTALEAPTWIPEALIMVGLAMFALQLISYGIRHLTAMPSLAPQEVGALSETHEA